MKTLDLFAGVGGVRTGMERAGFDTVYGNDVEPKCKLTYDLNFKPGLTVGDIQQIDIDSLPDFDVLTGGFPCQPFSISGKRLGFNDTRGTLFFRIAEILHERKPSMFLLENVKMLYHHDGGKTFGVIQDVLQDLGYHIHYDILNALDYGIPQNRERVFIVGFREDVPFKFPKKQKLELSVKDLLEDDVDERFFIRSDHKHYEKISQGVTDPDKVYQWRWSYVRENKKNVCPTLLASYMQPTLVKTDKGIRGITPREGFRLQGFPDTYELPDVNDKVLMHQVGNSVCINVVEAIAKEMYKFK